LHYQKKDNRVHFFKSGDFIGNATIEKMIEICVLTMVKQGFEETKAREIMNNLFLFLKIWQSFHLT
jgi:hypothetical protein